MAYKNIFINLAIRIIILTLTCVGFGLAVTLTKDYFTIVNMGILIVLQSWLMMAFLNKTNKDIAFFIDSIKSEDSNILFSKQRKGILFQKLYESFDEFNLLMQKTKANLITQNQYFKTVADHVNIGLLSIDENENIEFINKKCSEFFEIDFIKNLNSIKKIDKHLYYFIKKLEIGKSATYKYIHENSMHVLLFKATQLKTKDKTLSIIAFQDIKPELDEKEIDAWQKLIKVLNHEIMNSITPINSTIDAITDHLNSDAKQESKITKTLTGLDIVKERSEGLKEFVSKYRSLVNIPKPALKRISVKSLIHDIKILMEKDFTKAEIKFSFSIKPEDLSFDADKNLIEQVLINILKNAIDSFDYKQHGKKTISIDATRNLQKNITIKVANNGKTIPKEIIENIFIPFYTTKKEGSGIGLSLSKQIINSHGGEIRLVPSKDFTIFELKFN